MKNVDDIGKDYSYREYLPGLQLRERVGLIHLVGDLLSKGNLDMLLPFSFPVTPSNYPLCKFIHDHVLWQRPLMETATTFLAIDPAIDGQTLSDFRNDLDSFKSTGITLSIALGRLKILNQEHIINANNKTMKLLLRLLNAFPETVSYSELIAELELTEDDVDSLRMIKRDLYRYLQQQGFTQIAIDHVKKNLLTHENIGYQLT